MPSLPLCSRTCRSHLLKPGNRGYWTCLWTCPKNKKTPTWLSTSCSSTREWLILQRRREPRTSWRIVSPLWKLSGKLKKTKSSSGRSRLRETWLPRFSLPTRAICLRTCSLIKTLYLRPLPNLSSLLVLMRMLTTNELSARTKSNADLSASSEKGLKTLCWLRFPKDLT